MQIPWLAAAPHLPATTSHLTLCLHLTCRSNEYKTATPAHRDCSILMKSNNRRAFVHNVDDRAEGQTLDVTPLGGFWNKYLTSNDHSSELEADLHSVGTDNFGYASTFLIE